MAALAAPARFSVEALQQVSKLTSVQDINRLLNETAAKERGIDEELEQLLNQRSQLERSVSSLHATTSQVSTCSLPVPALCAKLFMELVSRLPLMYLAALVAVQQGADTVLLELLTKWA